MTTQIIKYQSTHGEVALSVQDIKQMFCPKATDQEARMFLEICRYQGLNPFLKEAYLVKYSDNDPASIVVGKEVFTKRAQRLTERGLCLGWEAGIVVARDNKLEHLDGSMSLPGDVLLGGWCRVRRPNQEPFEHTVELKEYIQTTRDGRPTKFWAKMPATMIRKVALVQGLRECFPDDFQGLYDSAEITGGQVVETTGIVVSQVDNTSGQLLPGSEGELETNPMMFCPVHQKEWFQSKNMRQEAHPIEGEKGPRGGAKWCNQKDVLDDFSFRMKAITRAKGWDGDEIKERGEAWAVMTPTEKLGTVVHYEDETPNPTDEPPGDCPHDWDEAKGVCTMCGEKIEPPEMDMDAPVTPVGQQEH